MLRARLTLTCSNHDEICQTQAAIKGIENFDFSQGLTFKKFRLKKSNMLLPLEDITIIGDIPEANSLSQVLKLNILSQQILQRQSNQDNSPVYIISLADVKFHIDKQPLEKVNEFRIDRDRIKRSKLVILLSSIPYPNIIHLIHYLRGNLGWEGLFISIVKNEEQKVNLENSSLFFEQGYRLYGKSLGHKALLRPIKVLQIINTIKTSRIICRSLWNDTWLSQSSLMQISKLDITSSTSDILKIIDSIDTRLIPHEFKDLCDLIERLKKLNNITDDSFNELKSKIDKLLK